MGTSRLGNLLVEEGLLSEQDRRTIRNATGHDGAAFAKGLIALGLLDEDDLAAFLADRTHHKIAKKNITHEMDDTALGILDIPLLERLEIVPLHLKGNVLTVAMADPLDRETLRQIEFFTGCRVRPVIATLSQIHTGLKKLVNSYTPRQTEFESFLQNHASAAVRRLRALSGQGGAHKKAKKQDTKDEFDAQSTDAISMDDGNSGSSDHLGEDMGSDIGGSPNFASTASPSAPSESLDGDFGAGADAAANISFDAGATAAEGGESLTESGLSVDDILGFSEKPANPIAGIDADDALADFLAQGDSPTETPTEEQPATEASSETPDSSVAEMSAIPDETSAAETPSAADPLDIMAGLEASEASAADPSDIMAGLEASAAPGGPGASETDPLPGLETQAEEASEAPESSDDLMDVLGSDEAAVPEAGLEDGSAISAATETAAETPIEVSEETPAETSADPFVDPVLDAVDTVEAATNEANAEMATSEPNIDLGIDSGIDSVLGDTLFDEPAFDSANLESPGTSDPSFEASKLETQSLDEVSPAEANPGEASLSQENPGEALSDELNSEKADTETVNSEIDTLDNLDHLIGDDLPPSETAAADAQGLLTDSESSTDMPDDMSDISSTIGDDLGDLSDPPESDPSNSNAAPTHAHFDVDPLADIGETNPEAAKWEQFVGAANRALVSASMSSSADAALASTAKILSNSFGSATPPGFVFVADSKGQMTNGHFWLHPGKASPLNPAQIHIFASALTPNLMTQLTAANANDSAPKLLSKALPEGEYSSTIKPAFGSAAEVVVLGANTAKGHVLFGFAAVDLVHGHAGVQGSLTELARAILSRN